MVHTFEVLKWLTSREVRLEQPANISLMFVTFDVLKLVTSMEIKLEQ